MPVELKTFSLNLFRKSGRAEMAHTFNPRAQRAEAEVSEFETSLVSEWVQGHQAIQINWVSNHSPLPSPPQEKKEEESQNHSLSFLSIFLI